MLAAKESFVLLFLLLLVNLNVLKSAEGPREVKRNERNVSDSQCQQLGSHGCLLSNFVSNPVYIKATDSFLKECSCDETNSKSSARSLKWEDSDHREIGPRCENQMCSHILEQEPNVYTERSNYTLTLYMKSASLQLSGNYVCTADNNGATYTHVYPVIVYEPVQFINTKSEQNIVNGRDSRITCQAHGYTQIEYHWLKDDEVIKFGNGEKYRREPEGLIIRDVTKEDEGIYTCTASVDITAETVSKYIKVSVFTQPEIKSLVAEPQSPVVSGQSLNLDCVAEGTPTPKISWQKISYEEYADTKNISWYSDKNKLTFNNIQDTDRGTYECTALNAAGADRGNITIEVNTPPIIQSFENFTGDEGTEGRLICAASGRPQPAVSVEYHTADDSIRFSINHSSGTSTEYEIYFENLKRNHAGSFTCIASNEVGKVSQVAEVSVNHKPYFDMEVETEYGWEGAVIRLKCEPHSQPPARIVWSYGDSTITNIRRKTEDGNQHLDIKIAKENPQYGQYTCTASNELGTATKHINLVEGFVPTKIYNVKISDIKATTVTVTFDTPISGPNITSYTAEYDEADIYSVQSIHQNRTWAPDIKLYKLENLKPGTKYIIRVAATNGVGTGVYSDIVVFETPRKSSPEAPTYETLNPLPSERKLDLKIIRPDDNGDPIDYYYIKYCPLIDFSTGEINKTMCKDMTTLANEEKVKLTDLENNETYLIQIFAHNSEGNSPANAFNFLMPAAPSTDLLISTGVIIGIVVLMVLAILLMDLLLCATRKKGMIAACCLRKNRKKNINVNSRERKGLLRNSRDADGVRPNNGQTEYEHTENTRDIITGKHSEV